MKRVLLTFMAAAATVAATAQDIYKTDFSTEDEFQKWTVIDANEDNTTWKFDAGEASHTFITLIRLRTKQTTGWFLLPSPQRKRVTCGEIYHLWYQLW